MDINDFKGLRVYMIVLLICLCFFTYSQATGWKWIGATSTSPPTGDEKTRGGYRYFYHK
jgi:hypothetical protein